MKNIAPNIIEEMSGNSICQESPGKHPGKEHLLRFWIKEACFRIKTSLTKVVGIIFSKSKSVQKKCSGTPGKHPGNTHEMPGKHQGKVHLLMFWIKVASLAKAVGIFNKVKER